jgi:hypothetical protein
MGFCVIYAVCNGAIGRRDRGFGAMTRLIALLLSALFLAGPAAVAQNAPKLPGASPTNLPKGSPIIGPLTRGPDGQIELVTPETERAAGRPLCDAHAKCVGKGEPYATLAAALAAAQPGDTIDLVAATYHGATTVTVPRLTIRGTAGTPHIDCAGAALGPGNACLVAAADGVTFDNLEISAAAGACVASDGAYTISLSGIFCHGSKAGFEAEAGKVSLVHSQFYDNADGIALGAGCASVTVSGSIFRDAANGDEFSSRCADTEISDSEIHSVRSLRALDLPVGGKAMIYRTTLEKGAQSQGGDIVDFARDSCAHPGTMTLKEVEIDNYRFDGKLINFGKCANSPLVLDNVTVSGEEVMTQGVFTDLGGNQLNPAAVVPVTSTAPPSDATSLPGGEPWSAPPQSTYDPSQSTYDPSQSTYDPYAEPQQTGPQGFGAPPIGGGGGFGGGHHGGSHKAAAKTPG